MIYLTIISVKIFRRKFKWKYKIFKSFHLTGIYLHFTLQLNYSRYVNHRTRWYLIIKTRSPALQLMKLWLVSFMRSTRRTATSFILKDIYTHTQPHTHTHMKYMDSYTYNWLIHMYTLYVYTSILVNNSNSKTDEYI